MARYTYVVHTNPSEGQEQEYNRWYDEVHIPEVLQVPGFVSASRLAIAQPDAEAPYRYLALYEMETNDLEATMAELMSRAGTPAMPISDSMNAEAVRTIVADQLGARVLAPLTTA